MKLLHSQKILTLTHQEARKAERHLAEKDPAIKKLISKHGPCDLPERPFRPFEALASAVIGQQLSAKAANTIEARVRKTLGGRIGAKRFIAVAPEALRAAGLSHAKTRCLMELSRRVSEGELNFNRLRWLHEEEAICTLTTLPGVGRWTAEMFLIFSLKRPNVLSISDAGLRRAARLLYQTEELEERAKYWDPYCSVASWYLWRHLDN